MPSWNRTTYGGTPSHATTTSPLRTPTVHLPPRPLCLAIIFQPKLALLIPIPETIQAAVSFSANFTRTPPPGVWNAYIVPHTSITQVTSSLRTKALKKITNQEVVLIFHRVKQILSIFCNRLFNCGTAGDSFSSTNIHQESNNELTNSH
jgi:hypothetical protein